MVNSPFQRQKIKPMLHITGDLVISHGTETVKIKTNNENLLVLSFSSWKVFGAFMRLPKTAKTSFFELRQKLKHLSNPVRIEVGSNHSFLLVKGKPRSISISTIFKVIIYGFIK